MTGETEREDGAMRYPTKNTIKVLNRRMPVPNSRTGRIGLGIVLILGGILGFLPVVGFWMLPLGVLVLAHDMPGVRRWRRKMIVRWYRKKEIRGE